ncbi:hypothetical protein [Kitasatospora aureofaciens]|uniref:hypothetical protein n=1 Tax=Kitasatospora aureofaciens TaxID=1894 RepID=UPI001C48332F|nr:hypothetical protein [Kitasatospora aureofaciens]MBV6700121.1 hypothetical protein [Kitasatospora aureofaciens]
MGSQGEPARPPHVEQPIVASVTVSGTDAAFLRELAAVLGRTPQALALEYATGALKLPADAIGESEFADWALFDGPHDLAEKTKGALPGRGRPGRAPGKQVRPS